MKVAISGEVENIGGLEIQDIEGLGVYNKELIGFTSTGSIFKLDPKTGQIISKERMKKYEEQEEQDIDTVDVKSFNNESLNDDTDEISIKPIDEDNQLSVDVTEKVEITPDPTENQEGDATDESIDQSEDIDDENEQPKSDVEPSRIKPLQFTGAASNFNQLSTTE